MNGYNILFLAPRVPYPLDTGAKIRTYNLLSYIASRHRVTLLCFQWSPDDEQYRAVLKRIVSRLIYIPCYRYAITGRALRALRGIVQSIPLVISRYIDQDMKRAVAECLSSDRYDMVHCDHLHMAYYGEKLTSVGRVLDEHNIEYRIWHRYGEAAGSFLKRAFLKYQGNRMRDYEQRIVRAFDRCCVVSAEDGALLRTLCPEARITVVSNGVDTRYFTPAQSITDPYSMVFTGSMNWLPNEDAMRFFLKDILPLIKSQAPNAQLHIVGQSPSAVLRKSAEGLPSVHITGRVDDVRPYIARASVYIVPLRIGGGTRLKILEAMAMGKPVISTTIGAEGIEALPDQHLEIADDPAAFAGRVVALMNNEHRRAELGGNARQLTERKYSWDIIGSLLEGVYHTVCGT